MLLLNNTTILTHTEGKQLVPQAVLVLIHNVLKIRQVGHDVFLFERRQTVKGNRLQVSKLTKRKGCYTRMLSSEREMRSS